MRTAGDSREERQTCGEVAASGPSGGATLVGASRRYEF